MFFLATYILCFTFFNIIDQIPSLELPAKEDKDVIRTEWILPNIVNNLFDTLKLNHVKHTQKFKQYLIIHNFFVSITLQDHVNLKKIAKVTKVDHKIDNNTNIFITLLNELFIKDNNTDETTDDVYVTMFIKAFHKNLEDLKEVYGLNRNINNFNINKEVLRHLSKDEHDFENVTIFQKINDSNTNDTGGNEFWRPSGRRVYQGKSVHINRFPFMVSVQFFKRFQCGGSIIKSDLVITSASCLQLAWNNRFFRENPTFLSVQMGSDVYEHGKENIPILEIYFHPNYSPKNLMHNLALMTLVMHINLHHSQRVKKIEFDRNPSPLPANTESITIVGWGARSFQNVILNPLRNPLSMAVLDYYPFQECQDVYSKTYVTERHFCAGFFSKGGGACNHDAGGPGIAHGILVGVISFGSPVCGAPDAPTVFTKLGYYVDWIEKIMKQRIPVLHRMTTTTTTMYPPIEDIELQESFTQTEASRFKLKPITPKKSESNLALSVSLDQENRDILRLKKLEKDRFFENFLTTMFDSEEIDQYIDQLQAKIDEETVENVTKDPIQSKIKSATKPKSTLKTKSKSKSKTKLSIKSKPKLERQSKTKLQKKSQKKTKRKSVTKYVKNIQKQAADVVKVKPVQSDRITSVPEFNHKHKSIKANSTFDENKKLESVIATIFDNLDIPDFLELQLSSDEKQAILLRNEEEKIKSIDQNQQNKQIESEPDEPLTEGVIESADDSKPIVVQRTENTQDEEINKNYEENLSDKNVETQCSEEDDSNDNENNYEIESDENYEEIDDDENDKQNSAGKNENNETGNTGDIENNYESNHSTNKSDEDDYEALSIPTNSVTDSKNT